MRLLIFAALLAVTLSSQVYQATRLVLDRNLKNTLRFVVGAMDSRNSAVGILKESYSYSFKGLPSFLRVNGEVVEGVVPANCNGDFSVTIVYRSASTKHSGSETYIFTCQPQAVGKGNKKGNVLTYFKGIYDSNSGLMQAGGYTVLTPLLQAGVANASQYRLPQDQISIDTASQKQLRTTPRPPPNPSINSPSSSSNTVPQNVISTNSNPSPSSTSKNAETNGAAQSNKPPQQTSGNTNPPVNSTTTVKTQPNTIPNSIPTSVPPTNQATGTSNPSSNPQNIIPSSPNSIFSLTSLSGQSQLILSQFTKVNSVANTPATTNPPSQPVDQTPTTTTPTKQSSPTQTTSTTTTSSNNLSTTSSQSSAAPSNPPSNTASIPAAPSSSSSTPLTSDSKTNSTASNIPSLSSTGPVLFGGLTGGIFSGILTGGSPSPQSASSLPLTTDITCNNTNTSIFPSTGTVTSSSSKSIEIDNTVTVQLGACTDVTYFPNKSKFDVGDKVYFDGYLTSRQNLYWGRRVYCQCN